MSGIISAIGGLASASWKALIAILMAIISGIIISVFIGASFDIVQSSVQDNSAASGAVEAGRTAYDVGSTVEDVYDFWKILIPVGVAIAGVATAVIVLIKKASSLL